MVFGELPKKNGRKMQFSLLIVGVWLEILYFWGHNN